MPEYIIRSWKTTPPAGTDLKLFTFTPLASIYNYLQIPIFTMYINLSMGVKSAVCTYNYGRVKIWG